MTFVTHRRSAVAAVIALSSAAVLAGCSGGTASADGIDLSQDAPTGVTLTVWHNTADSPALLALYDAYEAASGNTIDLVDIPSDQYTSTVQTKWATGERPDVLEYGPTPQDMAQLNITENAFSLNDFAFVGNRVSDAIGVIDGTTYAAVLGPMSSFVAYYNKDVLAAAGVSVPETYDDIIADCGAISATGAVPVSVGGGSEFPAMMIGGFSYMADFNTGDAWGASIADGTAKVSDPSGPIVAGLTAVDDLRTQGCVNTDAATATFQDSIAAVLDGSAAITFLPSDMIAMFYGDGGVSPAVDDVVGLTAISAKNATASYSPSSSGSYLIPKTGDATKERAAADFVEFATGAGYQDYVDAAQIVPTFTGATAPTFEGMYATVADLIESPDSTPAFNMSVPGFGNFGKIAVSVLVGQSTPQQAADDWQKFVDQAIAAQN